MNAILRRELISLLRTKRAAAVQLGLALAFALLIGLRWPTEAQVGLSGAEARPVLDVGGYGGSSDAALRITYGLVVVVTVAVLGPYALLQGGEGWPTALASWVRCLSPVPAVMELLGHGDVGSQGLTAGFSATARYVLLA